MAASSLVSEIRQRIYLIRGFQVVLDVDIANFYQIPTRKINQQVRRNRARFPEDFMFELEQTEYEALKLQNVALSEQKYRRYIHLVFTAEGVAMLSGILKSEQAVEVNIAIMRAFVQFRMAKSMEETLRNKEYHRRLDLLSEERAQQSTAAFHAKEPPLPKKKEIIEEIQKLVAEYFDLKVMVLKNSSRAGTAALARQIAMYLVRTETGLGLQAIGAVFGGRDHTTVLHACRKIEASMQFDTEIRVVVQSVMESLKRDKPKPNSWTH